jgi:hypothetical protein
MCLIIIQIYTPPFKKQDIVQFSLGHKFFPFQNAWSGGYIAGTNIGKSALGAYLQEGVL